MSVNITDEQRRSIELRIEKWRGEFDAYRFGGQISLAMQVGNWLFGLQIGLDMLGLNDLAKFAEDAQKATLQENP
jgi:hypothetical protein